VLGGGGSRDEIAIANDSDAGDGFGGAVIIGVESRAERRRTQDFAVQHAADAGRRVLMAASDEIAGVDFGKGLRRWSSRAAG